MKITVPDDCGNSPRNLLVSQFAVDWAAGSIEKLRPLLADEAQWEVMGAAESNLESALSLPQHVSEVEIFTAINHGKTSSSSGFMLADGGRIDFCHVFQFSGVAKTAKIISIRSYVVHS